MSTELVLLLGIYAFILLGVFLGDLGPIETFRKSAPRFGAKLERDISIGTRFYRADQGTRIPGWEEPSNARRNGN